MLGQDDALSSTSMSVDWIAASVPILLSVLLLVAALGAAGVWVLAQRARELARIDARLSALEDLRAALDKLAAERDVLDLRRLEHVLIEIRDGQRRVEDALLRSVRSSRPLAGPETSHAAIAASLPDRVVDRLLALGYERVQLVTSLAELEAFAAGEGGAATGEVIVEARRDGVLCKGRVLVRNGLLTQVEMKPALAAFP